MRYMVRGEFIDAGPLMPPKQVGDMVSNVVIPSLKAIARMEDEGRILASGVFTGQRAGVFILEADSNEKVSELLMSLPFWGLLKWEVSPLESFSYRAEQEGRITEQLQKRQ